MAAPYPTCYLDGAWLPLAEARISPLDRGFLFADGVYEVVPVHRGRPFRLREHLQRLDDSLRAIRITNPHDPAGWAAVLGRLATEAGDRELLLYLQVTRGAEAGRNHLLPKDVTQTVFAFASPYPAPSPTVMQQGLRAVTLEDIRWDRCDIKSVALLGNILLRQEAADRGADEALLVRDGRLLEGSSSSVFLCAGGTLVTPPNSHRILPGTSRDAVLELAEGWLPRQVADIDARDIAGCDELWISSAGRGVLPVTTVDGQPVGTGRPGPLWEEMYSRLQRHLDDIASTPAL
ncbi:MAG TPA: aminotransferase class IV [Steroidobacteraceae bacterium]|nr:aminotransferase class IV [Steroidobacteraceae bacterium]HQR49660.1 aminotransferase class IV [Steroidobacteraceae bacterium]